MRISLINGSPRPRKESVSGALLDALAARLGDEHELSPLRPDDGGDPRDLLASDALVLAFPLYVDALPAHLLSYLESLEPVLSDKKAEIPLYALVNCGFYEPEQCRVALRILRRWCEKQGLIWGQGLAVGGGPMISGLTIGQGPLTTIGRGLDVLAVNILTGASGDGGPGEDEYVRPNFPRFLYMRFANSSWKRQAKGNGLPVKDLRRGTRAT